MQYGSLLIKVHYMKIDAYFIPNFVTNSSKGKGKINNFSKKTDQKF